MDTYHHGDLKADLLRHARALVEQGGEAPALRELARRAGVSATAVYHHFPSKEELLVEVSAQMLEELLAGWAGLSLRELGPAYLRFFRDHPSALGLLFGPRMRSAPRVRMLQDQAYNALAAQLTGPHGPDHTAGLFLWALVHGLSHLYASGTLGADPVACPGGPDLWYQEPEAVLAALSPLLDRVLSPA